MMIRKGDRFEHKLSGHVYHVVSVKRGTVVLQEVNGSSKRLWFGAEGVELFFEAMERGN